MKASHLLGLVPSVMCENTTVDIDQAADMYRDLLPSPELLPQELARWKRRFSHLPPDNRPTSCAAVIKQLARQDFPNVAVLMQIACTLPVTSCECERSASVLRRLHSWCRASMGQERLTSLALSHVHYDTPVSLDTVVDIFSAKHPRRMQVDSLLVE